MTASDGYLLAATHARDAAYDVVLLAHVLAAAVGLGALVVAGANAWVLHRSGPGSEAVRRYYRPGVNWAGRVLFLVPVLGLSLMAMSHGDWSLSDGWITIGLALWAVVAVAAEMYLWPAERRLQSVVSSLAPVSPVEDDGEGTARVGAESAAGPGVGGGPASGLPTALPAECRRVVWLATSLSVVLVVVAVVMVAKP
jgi:uncharacterized membrane protein